MESSDNESSTSQSSAGTSSVNTKLTNCEVCSVSEAKYTCPRCEVRTCCLKCSVIHKKELKCSGARDRTKFIPISRFTNIDLSSDYRLLEEIARNIQVYRKNLPKPYVKKHGELPYGLWNLHKAAETRKTILKFLPKTFARRKQNTTHYFKATNNLMWHVEWVFALENLKLNDGNVSEDTKLSVVLQKYFVKQEDGAVQEKLQYYQSAGLGKVQVLLKAEQKAGQKFYELDLDETLKENLRNKIIIEYPIIHVILKDHISCYDIVDDNDNEDAMDVDKKGIDVINQIIKSAESDEAIYKSMKNLLFVSEYSDDSENESKQ